MCCLLSVLESQGKSSKCVPCPLCRGDAARPGGGGPAGGCRGSVGGMDEHWLVVLGTCQLATRFVQHRLNTVLPALHPLR